MKNVYFAYNVGSLPCPTRPDHAYIAKEISAADLKKLLIGRTCYSYIRDDIEMVEEIEKDLNIKLNPMDSFEPFSVFDINGIGILVYDYIYTLIYDVTGIIDELGILEKI